MADIKGLKVLVDMSKGYFLTTIINQMLPFLLIPILTRFMSTEEYGMLSLATLYLSISNACVGDCLPNAVNKYFYEKDKSFTAQMVGNCIYVALFLALALIVIVLMSYPLIGDFLNLPLAWMLLFPLSALAYNVLQIGFYVCRNQRKVFVFGVHQVGNTIINVLLSLLFVCVMYYGWMGRATGIILSYIISAIIMMVYLCRTGYLSWKYNNEMRREIVRIIMPLMPNALQMIVIGQAGVFFMQLYFSKSMLGQYFLAGQLCMSIYFLVDTIDMSWCPFMFEQLSDVNKMNKMYVTRLLWTLIIVVAGCALLLSLLAKPLIWLISTPDYYNAVLFIPWFSIGIVIYGVYGFISAILIKKNQQNFIGQMSFISMFIMIAANILFAKWFGYMGIVYAYCLTYVFLGLVFTIRAQKVFPLPWLKALFIWKN